MINESTSRRNLPIEELPARHRDASARAIEAIEAREREASAVRDAGVREVIREAKERRLKAVGPKKAVRLRRAMDDETMKLEGLREPPESLTADWEKAAQAREKRMDKLLGKLGVDAKELRGIGRDARAKLDKVIGDPGLVTPGYNLSRNLSKWAELSPLHQIPLDWGVRPPVDPADPGQTQVFGPSFPYSIQRFDYVQSDNFRVAREVNVYEGAGAAGNKLTMDCGDADDWDLAHGIVDTELVFVYEAPASGRVQVIVDAINTFGHHDLSIDNEWGWSEHWTNQNNYLSVMVYNSGSSVPSFAQMSNFYREGEESRSWSVRALTPGSHYYAIGTGNVPAEAGDTFFVSVGTRTFDITRANDVEVHSKSNFQWLIRSAEVRIVP